MKNLFIRSAGWGVGVVAGLATLGVVVSATHEPTPEPKPIVKTVVKYKTKTITKQVMPKACQDALAEASKAHDAAAVIASTGNTLRDILFDARVALSRDDTQGMVDVLNREKIMNDETVEAGNNLSRGLGMFEKAIDDCDVALNK